MKKIIQLLAISIIVISCGTSKTVSYFQDLPKFDTSFMAKKGEFVRVKPGDALSIVVHTGDPELDGQFNLYTNATRTSGGATATNKTSRTSGGGNQMSLYTVNEVGTIKFPILGDIEISGLDRQEIEDKIRNLLIDANLVKDPIVIVEFGNLYFSVLGSVKNPGCYPIDKDKITLLEALSKAGDLKITGRRQDVLVLRTEDDKVQKAYRLNLNNARQVYASPVFYIKQNDVIYVTPNKKELKESTASGNSAMSASFWISVFSVLLSTATTIIAITRK